MVYAYSRQRGSRSWQADEDAVSDSIISTREYGPVLHVGGEILQLTHEDRNDGCTVHFATVCALQTERCTVVGYVPRELSCKCSLSNVALRMPGQVATSAFLGVCAIYVRTSMRLFKIMRLIAACAY